MRTARLLVAVFLFAWSVADARADELYFECGIWNQSLLVRISRPLFGRVRLQYLADGEWTDFRVLSQNEAAVTVESGGWHYSNDEARQVLLQAPDNQAAKECSKAAECTYNIRFDLIAEKGDGLRYVYVAANACRRYEGALSWFKECNSYQRESTLGKGICEKREKIR